MKKWLSFLLVLSLTITTLAGITVFAAQENWLTAADSTFESGTTAWGKFSSGTVETVANPSGEGKVLKFSGGTNNWSSPSMDIRSVVQKNGQVGMEVYVQMDVYMVGDIKTKPIFRIRTGDDTPSFIPDGVTYNTIGGPTQTDSNTWVTATGTFTLDEEDMKNATNWTLCFDNIGTLTVYIDNVIICNKDNAPDPEETDTSKDVKLPEVKAITRTDTLQIGTIRWDAYSKSTKGAKDPASQVAAYLSPAKYHWTAPFFASVDQSGSIVFPEYTQKIWEQEAQYAIDAGIDYFAYLWYDTTDAMSTARKYHVADSLHNKIKMCGILESLPGSTKSFNELLDAMKGDYYLKVSGRPVVYLYDGLGDKWTQENINTLRQKAAQAGITEALYVVAMVQSLDTAKMSRANMSFGVDAFSWYSLGASKIGETYDELTKENMERLNKMAGTKLQIIPSFTAGRDTQARIETGVSWCENTRSGPDNLQYGGKFAYSGTSQQIAAHAAEIFKWVLDNPDLTQANLSLSYGWNEHDEGGWLCPTLKVDDKGAMILDASGKPQANTERLDELKKTIDSYRALEAKANAGEYTAPTPTAKTTEAPAATEAGATATTKPTAAKAGVNPWLVIIPVAAVLVIAGAVVAVLLIRKKQSIVDGEEENPEDNPENKPEDDTKDQQ